MQIMLPSIAWDFDVTDRFADRLLSVDRGGVAGRRKTLIVAADDAPADAAFDERRGRADDRHRAAAPAAARRRSAAVAFPRRAALIGLTVMFLLIRMFHTHDHNVPVTDETVTDETVTDETVTDETVTEEMNHKHGEDCGHGPSHHDGDVKGISWAGLFFGLLMHTLVDGVALASSVIADASHGAWMGLAGLGTFLAVLLHKPLDAFAITSVMNKQNWAKPAQDAANVAFSLACPAGAIAFYFGATTLAANSSVLGWGLAISAGFFIGIALADLLPEVAFHHHDRGKLTFAFLLGIAVAVGIENLPGHNHEHSSNDGEVTRDVQDDHAGHDHDH